MKVVAITEVSTYYGGNSPRRFLIDITVEELTKLTGTDNNREATNLKIGDEINIGTISNNIESIRRFINQKQYVVDQMRRYCDEVENIEVPKLTKEKK